MYNLKKNQEAIVATSPENNVILDGSCKTRPDIEYPTKWGFKLIGRDKDKLLLCIKEIMKTRRYTCHRGNVSKTGKFQSYNTSCMVESEEDRNQLFKAFETHSAVNMVI